MTEKCWTNNFFLRTKFRPDFFSIKNKQPKIVLEFGPKKCSVEVFFGQIVFRPTILSTEKIPAEVVFHQKLFWSSNYFSPKNLSAKNVFNRNKLPGLIPAKTFFGQKFSRPMFFFGRNLFGRTIFWPKKKFALRKIQFLSTAYSLQPFACSLF